jgi:type I restriction enzyme S subunit
MNAPAYGAALSDEPRWQTALLRDVADIGAGNSAPQKKEFFEGGIHSFIRTSDVGQIRFGAIEGARDLLNDKGISGLRLVPAGTVLMPKSGASTFLNHRVVMSVDGYVSSHLATITARQGIAASRYLLYYLSTVKAQDLIQDHKYPSLTLETIGNIRVPVPPPAQQKRIIAALDQAFAALDRARANAEANLADAHELFGAALNAVIRRSSHQQQKKLRLGSIVTRLTNGYVGPIRNIYVDTGVPYLLARHVRNNTLAFDGRTYISPAFNEKHKKSKLKAGDVLLVQSGHIGHSAVVPEAHAGHNCHAMIVISPKDEIASGPFLSMMFNTPAMQETFQNIRTGSTVPHLTCRMVKELLVEIPPREVQSQIMAQADQLRAQTETAKDRYEANISDIAALRQSLLQKAFAGQLA